ncbi:MAG: geranylgeranylglyceryl/heptaprenylglyceryl phosphate synthase [Saprospiraceae bacterium]|jgi:phosphoglycerol geranylgeranyltransferase
MQPESVYQTIASAKKQGKKLFTVLIDPDKSRMEQLPKLLEAAASEQVDFFFVGGSLLFQDRLEECLDLIQTNCPIPVVLFPGSPLQISKNARALLLLALISGRNPELLIGQHVIAAPYLKNAGIEIIPTGYVLVDGGKTTSAAYISNTMPIPVDKPEIAACTAMAGEMLGLRLLYLDAGSGAHRPVPPQTTRAVAQSVDIPLIVGGGLRTPEQINAQFSAGADMVVVGNAFEENPDLLKVLAKRTQLP